MKIIDRILNIELPPRQSGLFVGARKPGINLPEEKLPRQPGF